jgi:hypothetical protein
VSGTPWHELSARYLGTGPQLAGDEIIMPGWSQWRAFDAIAPLELMTQSCLICSSFPRCSELRSSIWLILIAFRQVQAGRLPRLRPLTQALSLEADGCPAVISGTPGKTTVSVCQRMPSAIALPMGVIRMRVMPELRIAISVRFTVILVTIALSLSTVAAVIGAAAGNLRYGLPTHNKTDVLNTVIATGAFILVGWGVIVALAAYVSSTGAPDLSMTLRFLLSPPNEPTFLAAEGKNDQLIITNSTVRQTIGTVVIANTSKYSARNPGLRIRLVNLSELQEQPGWTIIDRDLAGKIREIQWDGGADYIIHGRWSRTLPQLDFEGVFAQERSQALVIFLAADGFGPERKLIKLKLLNEEEYDDYSSRRADEIILEQEERRANRRAAPRWKSWFRNRSRSSPAPPS